MRESQRTALVFVAVFFLTSTALRGCKMLVALGALELGTSEFSIGVLAAAFGLSPLLMSVHAGRVSDRMGPCRPIVWGAAAMTAALVLPILQRGFVTLFLCPLLLGLGQIFIQIAVHNAVGLLSSLETRSKNYATLSLGVSVAAFVGPLAVGTMVDHYGLKAGFGLLAVTALLIAAPAVLFAHRIEPPMRERTEQGGGRALDLLAQPKLRRVVLTSGVAMCGAELFAFYIPIYGDSIGLSATLIGAVLAAHAAAAVVVRLGTGLLLRHYSELSLLSAALFVAAFGFAVIPMFGHVAVLFGISFLLGLGLGVASPLTMSLTYDAAPDGRSGEALGLRVLLNKVTQIVVPLTFGAIGTAFGMAPVFWANTAILAIGGLVTMLGSRAAPGERQ